MAKNQSKPETGLSDGARNLLGDLARDGKAKVSGRKDSAVELERAGLINLKKGAATLTRAGRWAVGGKSNDH